MKSLGALRGPCEIYGSESRMTSQMKNKIAQGVPIVNGDTELSLHFGTFVEAECYVILQNHTVDIPETGAIAIPIQTGKRITELPVSVGILVY